MTQAQGVFDLCGGVGYTPSPALGNRGRWSETHREHSHTGLGTILKANSEILTDLLVEEVLVETRSEVKRDSEPADKFRDSLMSVALAYEMDCWSVDKSVVQRTYRSSRGMLCLDEQSNPLPHGTQIPRQLTSLQE